MCCVNVPLLQPHFVRLRADSHLVGIATHCNTYTWARQWRRGLFPSEFLPRRLDIFEKRNESDG
jgi:hypothetical protein